MKYFFHNRHAYPRCDFYGSLKIPTNTIDYENVSGLTNVITLKGAHRTRVVIQLILHHFSVWP